MIQYLIATHGELAKGYQSSISILMGKEYSDKIQVINAFGEGGEKNPKEKIANVCDSLGPDDQLILFTDMMYGSVNQFAFPYANRENIFIISGINLPLVIEIIAKYEFSVPKIEVDKKTLLELIEKSRDQIVYVNDAVPKAENDADDFFQ